MWSGLGRYCAQTRVNAGLLDEITRCCLEKESLASLSRRVKRFFKEGQTEIVLKGSHSLLSLNEIV
jgi:hypothetical protein